MFKFLFDTLGDGFTIRHLRRTDIRIYIELPTQTINDNFQVQFTHTRDDGLPPTPHR